MGKVDVELMRRHIGTGHHEAEIAKRAGIDYWLVVGLRDAIEFTGFRLVDQIKEPRKGIAQVEAAPTAMADVEHPLELGIDLIHVVVVRIVPVDPVTGRRIKAAFAHSYPLAAPYKAALRPLNGGAVRQQFIANRPASLGAAGRLPLT